MMLLGAHITASFDLDGLYELIALPIIDRTAPVYGKTR